MAWAAVRDWLDVKVWTEGNEEAAPEGVRPFSRWHTLPDHESLALAELAATGVPRNYAVVHAASERYLQESYQQAHNKVRSSSSSAAASEGPALPNSDEEAEELLQSLMSKKSRKSLESAKSLAAAAAAAAAATEADAATDAARSLAGIVIDPPIVRTPPPMVHSPLAAGGSGMAQSPAASPAVGLSQ